MNWKERAAVYLIEKGPLPVPPKPPKAVDKYFCRFSQYGGRPISENKGRSRPIFQDSLCRDPSKPSKGGLESNLYIDSATTAIS